MGPEQREQQHPVQTNMATENLCKDVGEVYARLLDHRAVLHGEINFFLTEFEKRRGDSEVIRLQKMLENTREMHERLLPDSLQAMETNLPALTAAVKEANNKCQEILQNEGTSIKEQWLEEQRAARVVEWMGFMEEMCESSGRVDEDHSAEVDQVRQYYTNIEDRLNINKS